MYFIYSILVMSDKFCVAVFLSPNTTFLGGSVNFFTGLFSKTLKLSIPSLTSLQNCFFSSVPSSRNDKPFWSLVLQQIWVILSAHPSKWSAPPPSPSFYASHIDLFLSKSLWVNTPWLITINPCRDCFLHFSTLREFKHCSHPDVGSEVWHCYSLYWRGYTLIHIFSS